jgi:hypothetical protein
MEHDLVPVERPNAIGSVVVVLCHHSRYAVNTLGIRRRARHIVPAADTAAPVEVYRW